MADRAGQQLGNYRLLRLIGQGGFGEVYLGEHIYLKTQVAVKVLQVRVANEDVDGFLQEARTIAGLKHTHIIRVLDFGIMEGVPYFVMDYAPYGTLRQRYPKNSRLPLTSIVAYLKQVADALQFAHDHKLIHRDVKPENMLLGENGEVLLSDFGVALVVQSSHNQSTQAIAGTVLYMAPEQLQGHPRPASDQYALGIVVYEWLCGERPFHGTFVEIFSQQALASPPPLREKVAFISPDVEQVVMTALAKDPQQRFRSIRAFANAFEQASYSKPRQSSLSGLPFQPPVAHVTQVSEPSQSTAAATPHPVRPSSLIDATSLSSELQTPKHPLSRRAVAIGLVGLAGSLAASGLIWLAFSYSSSGPTTNTSTTPTPSLHTHTPTSTRTPPPIGTLLYTYSNHTRKIRALSWSHDGKRIASASDDFTAQTWDAMAASHPIIYSGHRSFVEGVAWSPDNSQIVSGSADGTAQIWDSTTGNHIRTYSHGAWVNRVDWSSDGTRIVSCDQSGIAGHVVTVQVWEASTGKNIVTYRGHTNGVYAVSWSPNNTRVASAGYDGTLQIWDAARGRSIATYNGGGVFLFGMSWSPDGTQVAIGDTNGRLLVVDASSGSVIRAYPVHTSWVRDVSWSRDGMRIASGSYDQTVKIISADTGQTLYTYIAQPGHIDAVEWSPDSKFIASGNDVGDNSAGSVQVWQAT